MPVLVTYFSEFAGMAFADEYNVIPERSLQEGADKSYIWHSETAAAGTAGLSAEHAAVQSRRQSLTAYSSCRSGIQVNATHAVTM